MCLVSAVRATAGLASPVLTLHRYHQASKRLDVAVLVTVPLFALYEIGLLLFTSGQVRNAADVLLKRRLGLGSPWAAIVVNGLVLAGFLWVALRKHRWQRPSGVVPLLVIESALWGLLLGPATLLLRKLVALSAARPSSLAEDIVLGIGAGLYEELVFRLVFVAGGVLLLHRGLKVDPIWAVAVAMLGSSLVFAAFHHVGTYGEPFEPRVFVFRFLAGLLLGGLFVFRGFGVVCWTHALYDVFVAVHAAL